MTATIARPASNLTPRYRTTAIDCGAAHIRAHCRHLAIVVTIEGTIDAGNIDRVTDYIRQCSLVKNAVVLDLSGVTSFDPSAISMLYVLDDSCRAAGVEWALVPSLHVLDVLGSTGHETVFPLTHSAREALHNFADMISRRRELLLPLIKKTA